MKEPGIQYRRDSKGIDHWRGAIKDRGKYVYGSWRTNQADAKGDRIRLQARKLDGPLQNPSVMTLNAAVGRFLAGADEGVILSRKRRAYAPKTVRGYQQAFDDWILPELGHIPVDKLRRSQVQRWVDWLGTQRDAGTVRNTWAALAAFYRWYLRRTDHDDVVDPTHDIDLPAPSAPRERYADPAEARALLEVLPQELALPYALAFYAGLRRGEIQGLMYEDLADGWITVKRSLDPVAGFVTPKSGKAREIPVFEILEPYVASCEVGFVVGSRRASRWGVQSLGRPYTLRCAKHWQEAGLEPIGLHEARHCFVTTLVRAGYDIKLVQEWAGHADPSTTLRIYAKNRGRQEGLADRMNTYLEAR